ncbi:class I adenylate-forming enzyme family protein [Algimonas porphyrae]|nr:class I adenylate-forming enzyme family protein [Algimonas porphyrae]
MLTNSASMMGGTVSVVEGFTSLTDRIDDFAKARPGTPALIGPEEMLSWRDLQKRMDGWAHSLSEDPPPETVALLSTNTLDGLCAMLGILKVGAYVTLLPYHASDATIEVLLSDSGATVLVGDSDRLQALGHLHDVKTHSLGETISAMKAEPFESNPVINANTLFNCAYSSGTTSKPKGILQSHGLRNSQILSGGIMGMGPGRVSILSTPLDSDTTIVGLVGALGNGSTVILMERFSADGFCELVEMHGVTHTLMVPVQYERILASDSFDNTDLSSLQLSLCTGAPLSVATKIDLMDRWPGAFIEVYGLTEGGATTLLSLRDNPEKLSTVGRPFPGTDMRIIGDDDAELPVGEIGEIVGRDANMMVGYTDADAQSAIVWTSPDGLDFIRTGDLGAFDKDGFLTICGRKKDMLISGGYNIYPPDLETALSQHPAIFECAVIGRPDQRWGEVPVAYAGLRSNCDPSLLKQWVNERLGKTQRIADVRIIDSLPRNAGGKVDKNALRIMEEGKLSDG